MIVWPYTMGIVTFGAWVLGHLVLCSALLLLLGGSAVALACRCTIYSGRPWKRARWRMRCHLHPGEDFASRSQLLTGFSRARAVCDGARVRPGLTLAQRAAVPVLSMAILLGRGPWGQLLYATAETAMLIIAPPRMYKTVYLIGRVLDWHGAAIVCSTKGDVFLKTWRHRAARGRTRVLNPLGVGGIPSDFCYDLVAGCREPAVAARIAGALRSAGERQHSSGENEMFLLSAAALLGAYLYAADVSDQNYTIEDVAAWISRTDQGVPEEILRNAKVSRALHAISEYCRREGRTENSIRITAGSWLTWTAVPELLAAVTPQRERPLFSPAEFVLSGGDTLYLIARSSADAGLTNAVFSVLLEQIHYTALIEASRQPEGRLNPQLAYFLDEADRTVSVSVPDITADSSGHGIQVTTVVQSWAALGETWGEKGAAKLLQNSGILMLLGAGKEHGTAEAVSELTRRQGHDDGEHGISPAFLRTLPRRWAFVLVTTLDPVCVKIRPYWKRRGWKSPPPPVTRPAMARVIRPEGQVTEIITPLQPWARPGAALTHANGSGHRNGASHE
ncbi:MAG TPA: type IV secretory system conjugative DNA transfer family protein [Streptosporangiaceae bacterium]|nr:type IV secretory system conjugative DNA transfer family protein [Streptosporangiaceae bacterium]